jgi:hypothetical protein
MGLILAALYQRTGNLLASWTAQAATNTLMFVLLFGGYQ